ncbi:MAG: RHS domain-containing protein [Deltaproteobacteria bacterium]|nr:RHS domain-containing protein [Deltaproteobacteria bacterium]
MDRLVSSTLPNGITTDYQYNANSWLTYITTKQGTTTLSDYNYGFDNIGNITSKNTEQGNYSYNYDTTYQLTSAVSPAISESFTYDPTGNRTLDNSAPTGLTFGTTEYYYNSRNRLERVTLPDGRIATYTYDPFGRRVKKTITGGAGEGETYYLYSDEGLIGEYDQNGNLSKGYGWKPGSTWGTDPVFMAEGGNYYFYQNDHLGTPQRLTDINGNTVWSATYTAFGNAEVQVATVTNNLRFPGQYLDEETGFHYNWNRYYDPNTGRYTQEDPIGFAGGDDNLYSYASQNSINRKDPKGLSGFMGFGELSDKEKNDLIQRIQDDLAHFGEGVTDMTVRFPREVGKNLPCVINCVQNTEDYIDYKSRTMFCDNLNLSLMQFAGVPEVAAFADSVNKYCKAMAIVPLIPASYNCYKECTAPECHLDNK